MDAIMNRSLRPRHRPCESILVPTNLRESLEHDRTRGAPVQSVAAASVASNDAAARPPVRCCLWRSCQPLKAVSHCSSRSSSTRVELTRRRSSLISSPPRLDLPARQPPTCGHSSVADRRSSAVCRRFACIAVMAVVATAVRSSRSLSCTIVGALQLGARIQS